MELVECDMVCAFTGHRPEHLPWGTDERDLRCAALKTVLRQQIRALAARGCTTFLCGMARGCDTYFAEAVLTLREAGEVSNGKLIAMLPCPSQAERWSARDLARYRVLLERCDEVNVLEAAYTSGCMLRRNRAMVDAADVLLTVFDGGEGGTAATIRYAERRGLEIVSMWL